MSVERVALLIDADNVSIDVIEQAVAWIGARWGGPHVRRAYGTAEMAVKYQEQFKRLSIRPMVNLAAGKNSTDIALAVDAIDLVSQDRPATVVIASSDSDFAPLVSRLREKGCRVVGIGQKGKTGDETQALYDEFEVMSHRAGTRGATARGSSTRGGRGRRTHDTATAAAPALPVPAEPQAESPAAGLFEQFVGLIEQLPDERPVAADRPARSARSSAAGASATGANAAAAPPAPAKKRSRGRGGKGARGAAAGAAAAAAPASPAEPRLASAAQAVGAPAAGPAPGETPAPGAAPAKKRSSRGRGRGGKAQRPQALKSDPKP